MTFLSVIFFNLLDTFKSIVKKRKPVHKRIHFIDIYFVGSTYINSNNGTTVIINESVYKFYFKNIEYYYVLYKYISSLFNLKLTVNNNFVVIEQKKAKKVSQKIDDTDLLGMIQFPLGNFHKLINHISSDLDYFTIPQKIKQLFKCYNTDIHHYNEYLTLGESFLVKSDPSRHVLCHGDLWNENVLLDNMNNIVLIDFDKAVVFYPTYDYTYYYLMSRVMKKVKSLTHIALEMNYYAKEINNFLNFECVKLSCHHEISDIKSSIFLFTFLKLIEFDLRHDKINNSIEVIKKSLINL